MGHSQDLNACAKGNQAQALEEPSGLRYWRHRMEARWRPTLGQLSSQQ
jgi:hypothetical protein